jgi:tRNA A64-2'-O-ribosylphosphate transferase
MEDQLEALPTKIESLIFPSAAKNFSKVFASVTKPESSIINYVNSIVQDANFVLKAAQSYKLPLVANERCGSWYVPTRDKRGSAYFKSTDGHQGNWKFSTRRLNLHLLEVAEKHNG